jgi:DNA polymerase III gamma/tau subunit
VPSPLLAVVAFGFGKTSLMRLLMKAMTCKKTKRETAEPCNECSNCTRFGAIYNGFGLPPRWEVDCGRRDRQELLDLIDEVQFEPHAVLFLDELHNLKEKNAESIFLKFIEDFPGKILAAITDDLFKVLLPPLRERFEKLYLYQPNAKEMVAHFSRMNDMWGVSADLDLLELMVVHSGRSFRTCQKILAAAAGCPGRVLTIDILKDFLTIPNQHNSSRTECSH